MTLKRKETIFFSLFVCFLLFASLEIPALSFEILAKSKKLKLERNEDEKAEEKTKEKKIEINENDFQPALLGALLEKPQDFIGKKIRFRGKFSSFTTLALDYKPALRKSKDYISICIFRPDSKVPLSELKLAYPVKEAKENQVIRDLEEGDLIEIFGEGFSAALDEPWIDILLIKKLESASKNSEEKKKGKAQEDKTLNGKELNKKNKKESK